MMAPSRPYLTGAVFQIWAALLGEASFEIGDGGETSPSGEGGRVSASDCRRWRVSVEARRALPCVGWLMGPGAPRRTVAAWVCAREWVYLSSVRPVEAFVGGGW